MRVEDATLVADKPYLAFHPTLPYAAAPEDVGDKEEARKRFVGVYLWLERVVNKALRGADPAGGMAMMAREEGNVRRAAAFAFELGAFQEGAYLADTIGLYLMMAGRVRDQARFAAWVQEQMAEASEPVKWATQQQQHAWGLFLAGKAREAVALLGRQLQEIEQAGGKVRQRALCLTMLGRILYHAGQPQHALGPLAKAIEGFEAAGDRGNLAAALGDHANALRALGKLAKALASSQRSVAITREQGNARDEVAALGQMAHILTEQHRYAEADQRYQEALGAARRAGDLGLEGMTLHHLGSLSSAQGRHALAVTRYKEALARFQAAEDRAAEMQTADLLGSAEQLLNHYDAARAWYAEAERLARALGDEKHLGVNAQNVGVLLRSQAQALPEEAQDERRRLLGEAAASVATSLAIDQKRDDEVGAAGSLQALGVIHLELGNLDEAERYAQQALAFYEPHNMPDVAKVYSNLEDIAVARNRPKEAAAWRAKKEAKRAELRRLARGGGPPRLPPQLRDGFLALCQALHAARAAGAPVPPDAADAIAHLCKQPDPLGAAGGFLARVAQGERPSVPAGLPEELATMFAALLEQLR